MHWFRQRIETVVDVRGTADAARLGRWLLTFQGLIIAGTGWWVDSQHDVPRNTVALGVLAVVAARVSALLPWARWRTTMIWLYPGTGLTVLLALAVVAPTAGTAYNGFLTLWFMFVGLVAALHSS